MLQVQTVEEGLVDRPSALLAGHPVKLGHVVDEVKGGLDDLRPTSELTRRAGQLCGHTFTLLRDALQPLPQLVLGQVAVGRQIQQSLLLGLQRACPLLQAGS